MSRQGEEANARYLAAMHAVQSGVAMEIELGISTDATPKHLRTGVNAAMVDSSALVALLIEKGIVAEEEYLEALAHAAEREQAGYENRLTLQLGKKVTLR